jgi:hypothetical protein
VIYLRLLGHIPVWDLQASLHRRERRAELVGEDGVKTLVVRDGAWRHPGLTANGTVKWPSLRNVISRANRMVDQVVPQYEIARAEFEELEPRARIPWADGQPGIAVHIGVVTNPAALLYSGNQAFGVSEGQIVAMEMEAVTSAVNHGETPRIHLILMLRKRMAEEE